MNNIVPNMFGYAYNNRGQTLSYKDSTGYKFEYTYDADGRILTYKNAGGFWYEYFRDLGVCVVNKVVQKL